MTANLQIHVDVNIQIWIDMDRAKKVQYSGRCGKSNEDGGKKVTVHSSPYDSYFYDFLDILVRRLV